MTTVRSNHDHNDSLMIHQQQHPYQYHQQQQEHQQYYYAQQLELVLGPVRDPLTTVIPMTLLYTVLLLTGTIGNVCTCIVIARNRYMHTATNFYLFSLAISDLLLLILGLPQELFMLWQRYPYVFGEFFCLVRGLSSETSTNASILTITAFTIERYVAICHPLKSHTMSQLPRAIKTILVIWAVSAICALPVAWQFGIIFWINKSPLRNISRQCGIKNVSFEYIFETAAIVFFLIPITLITILYVVIGINLRRSSQQINKSEYSPSAEMMANSGGGGSNNTKPHQLSSQYSETEYVNLYQRHNSVSSSHQKQIASRRSVVRMLVAVVIAFFFCYSPFHAQRVLATTMHRHKIGSPTIQSVYVVLTHISGVTYYLSATINPILYQVMSRKFRIAFKDTFGHYFPCLRNDIPEISYLNMIGGVSSHQLSRVPSFNSTYSFRRNSSSFGTAANHHHMMMMDQQSFSKSTTNSIKSVHSFDPISCVDDKHNNNNKRKKNDDEISTPDPDYQQQQNNRIQQANHKPKTAETTKQFKQFLDVPSIKF